MLVRLSSPPPTLNYRRLWLVSLFSDDPSEGLRDHFDDVYAHEKMLDVDLVSTIMRKITIDYFHLPEFAAMTLEIIFDACSKEDFEAMAKAALGIPIQHEGLGNLNPKDPNLPIT